MDYCLFDTPLGPCGVAWSGHGVTRLQLPEADAAATVMPMPAHDTRVATARPPPPIVHVIATVRRYLAGDRVDFAPVALDLSRVGSFGRKVYEAARSIGWGRTAMYGELARQIGCPGAARAVGQALSRNPIAIIVPCHRIVASAGGIGGFSAFGGTALKQRLLLLEGVRLPTRPPPLAGMAPAPRRSGSA